MKNLLLLALLAGSSASVMAQTASSQEESGREDSGEADEPGGWGLGVGAVATDSPYAGEGARVQPIPLISFEGENFFFQGITAGWRFIENDAFELAAVAKLRFDGFDIDDLGRRELAENGLDSRLLEDRDDSLDAGITAEWSGSAGELELELLADVTDSSGGQEISLQYGYPMQWGQTMVTPNIGVTWLSEDMSNYYFGTLEEEVARGVVDYRPDAVTIPHIGVNFVRMFGDRWSLLAMLEYSVLPDEIKDSPLLEPDTDGSASVLIGVSRNF